MGQIVVTLLKQTGWRNPLDPFGLVAYRELERSKKLGIRGDGIIVAIAPGQFSGTGIPDQIRVTVDWGDAAGTPLPSDS